MSADAPGPELPAVRRFHLREQIGQGSFGDVYLADQVSAGGFRRRVVLKVLTEDVAGMRGAGRRMRDEARVLGLLAHRHIVGVVDLVRLTDRWAILMDPVPGADLEQVLEALTLVGAPFPVPAALEVGVAVCSALAFASNAEDGDGGPLSVVHRDVKPSNVQLTVEGEIKVLDFGVARFSHVARESDTRPTAWIGTERYMSPERLLREGDTEAGDVYGAAATVLELILGRPLGTSPGAADPHAAFVDEALEVARPRIEAEPEAVDAVLAALRGALRADPAARPTARDLGETFAGLLPRIRGPGIVPFASGFVGRVGALLGRWPQPASGVLSEWAPTGTADTDSTRTRATLVPVERVAWPRRRYPLALAGVCLLVVAGILAVRPDRAFEAPPAAISAALVVPVESPVEAPVEVPAPAADPVAPAAEATPPPPKRARRAPKVDRAVVSVRDASRLEVDCGDVSAVGTASVRITRFPAGPCRVEAEWLGETYEAAVSIEQARSVSCRIEEKRLRCS